MKLNARPPVLHLLPEVEQRIRHFVDLAEGEVSGLGLVERVGDGFLVTEAFLPHQVCSATETELDDEAVAQVLLELDKRDADPAGLRFWWHSHADFDTFWSSTDESTVRSLANADWTVSLVVNKAGDRLARLDLWEPVRVTLDELPVRVDVPDLDLRAACEAEFGERVREITLGPLFPASKNATAWSKARLLKGEGPLSASAPIESDAADLWPDSAWADLMDDGPAGRAGTQGDGHDLP